MTDAPERIWATPTETVNNQPSWIDEIEVSHPDSFGGFDETGTEYIRADLARPMTVAEAAKVDFSGNMIILLAMASNFDHTKQTANAEFCRKAARDFAALRALSEGGE